jgi:phosphonopyruvate decarboxylase
MKVEELIKEIGADFYTGVPDSQLKALCNYLMNTYGIDKNHHVIAANEGNCTALAAGYHLATGKVPVVYMQNSGEGNIINPVASLLNDAVYAIPVLFIIGWRGEPGVHDEPQHVYQGKVTCKLLEDMDIAYSVIDKETDIDDISARMKEYKELFAQGKSAAFVVKKGALSYDEKVIYKNDYEMSREEIIRHIVKYTDDDIIVSTTGKASRELFEIREANGQDHSRDFLTVGSMGHSSSIAMGIAINKPQARVWCIDGDGAVLMHMGSMALMGSNKLTNMIHIVINNGAHETVGGMNTVANDIDLTGVAKACGYPNAVCVDSYEDLNKALEEAKNKKELSFIEVKCAIGARDDLGRPTTTARENKEALMSYIAKL